MDQFRAQYPVDDRAWVHLRVIGAWGDSGGRRTILKILSGFLIPRRIEAICRADMLPPPAHRNFVFGTRPLQVRFDVYRAKGIDDSGILESFVLIRCAF